MIASELANRAYHLWAKGDLDGLLGLVPYDAAFIIPAEKRIVGTHEKSGLIR
jgi:ketosteroid isomerase-like protein